MSATSFFKSLAVALIVATGTLGAYGSIVCASQNGLFDVLGHWAAKRTDEPYIPGLGSLKTHYSGIAFIDRQLSALTAFFAVTIDTKKSFALTLSTWYLMTQWWALWILIALEGLRRGNKGRAVSWTGIMGLFLQDITTTIVLPIYLILHLYTSPTARKPLGRSDVFSIDPADLRLLPLCTFIVLVLPSWAMGLSFPSSVSEATHQSILAFWQCFPLWNSILLVMLKCMLSSRNSQKPARKALLPAAAATIYKISLLFSVGSHMVTVVVCLIPASIVPASWYPFFTPDLRATFLPFPPWRQPSIDATLPLIPADALAPLGVDFLQWDMYAGNVAFMVWAVYLYIVACDRSSFATVAGKVMGWGVVGGPVAVAAALLWERDELVLDNAEKEE